MSVDSLKKMYDSANPMYDSANPMYDSANPMYDSANPNYDSEYHISYDAIYDDNSRIPTRSNECGKNNLSYLHKIPEGSCLCEFLKHSRYFLLYLFLMLTTLMGILYIFFIIPTK
jgi:hypothetical protein